MEIVTNIAPIALAIIMLGLGASLTVNDFLRVVKNPKDFFIGFICQLIVLPIVAYLLIITLGVPIEMALGVMLIAAAPGGVTSNVLTKFAEGDVALSISMTAVQSPFGLLLGPKGSGVFPLTQGFLRCHTHLRTPIPTLGPKALLGIFPT